MEGIYLDFDALEKDGIPKAKTIDYLRNRVNTNIAWDKLEESFKALPQEQREDLIYNALRSDNNWVAYPLSVPLKESEESLDFTPPLNQPQQANLPSSNIPASNPPLQIPNLTNQSPKELEQSFLQPTPTPPITEQILQKDDKVKTPLQSLSYFFNTQAKREDEAFKAKREVFYNDFLNKVLRDESSLAQEDKEAFLKVLEQKNISLMLAKKKGEESYRQEANKILQELIFKESQKQRILNTPSFYELSKEDKERVKSETSLWGKLWNNDEEELQAWKKEFIHNQAINEVKEAIIHLQNIHEYTSITAFSKKLIGGEIDEEVKSSYFKDLKTIASFYGFENAGINQDGDIFFSDKEGNFYKAEHNFLGSILPTLLANKYSIAGGISGSIMGAKLAPKGVGTLAGAVAGGAVGSYAGAGVDALISNQLLNRENNFKEIHRHMLEEGALSLVGDGVILGLVKGSNGILKLTTKSLGVVGKVAKNTPFVANAKNMMQSENLQAAQDLALRSFSKEETEELLAFAKNIGGAPQSLHSKDPNKGLEYLKEKFGEDSKIYKTAQSLENIFTPKMPLRAKQQELLAIIRNSEDNDVLDILKEVTKTNPEVNKNLRNMLGLTTANLKRELEKFEINPQDIKFIFDDYTKGTKAAYEEANEKILSKIYDDNYKVVLDSKEFDKFYEETLNNYELPSSFKNTLLSIKHKVYNPQGVTYKDLEATRKSLNNVYSEDKTLDSYLKNFISSHLREDINKGINNIFSQNKEAYKQAKTLYETKLADYAQLKEIQDSTIYKKIQNVDNSLEDIAKAILENAKGAGKVKEAGGEAGVTDKTLLNNFNELTKGLTEQNRQSLELNLLDKIFESSLIENGPTKVLDSTSFLKALEENKEIFKSKGSKEYIEAIQGFHKLFKRDADILNSLPNPNPKENNSNIATTLDGPIKHALVAGAFGRIYRNFTHDGILFGVFFPTIGLGIQKAALKYHLGKALKESSSLENFNFNITQRANRGGFNSPTKELVERIVEQVSEVKEEALRVAKEGTKAQEIPQDLKEQWLKEFNLESLEQDFIPNFTPEVKEVLQSIGIDKIQLKSGSLVKLDKRERLEFLPHIKPTLENPDVILKHLDSLIFVKDIGKESFFTSVSKGQNGEMIVRSNSFKTIQNLKNKLNTQGEVLFLNKEASNILTEAFTPKMFSKQLDTDIIPQSIDKANRFAEPFSNELFNALPKDIQAQYQSLQKQAREFNLKFQQAKDYDTKMAYRKQYNDTLDEIYNFEQIYPVRTPQSPTNLLDKALKEKQEGIIKEQQLQQQAQQEQIKRASLLKAKRQSIQQAKDSNVGKSVNEVELLLSDSIPYTPLRQTSINLENKTYNAKYVIIKKQDLKPNFTNTGTQGRLIKQTRVIEDIQNNLNPNKLFFSEGSFDGLPIILKDGSVSVGNHRAQALKNLSKESLQTYKEVAKKAFNVDLRDDEVIVRMLDSNIPKQEVLNLSFASNVGREQNIAEKALSTLGKYQEGISKLPKIITASSVEEMQSIISKTLDTTNNGLNTFDTNLALFTFLAKTRNKSILESLESLKGSAEEKQATLRMFVENAGNFYNISQQTLMPKLDLRDYLAQALYFTIKASPSRRDNFREVITQIQDLLKTTNTQGKNAFIGQNPYYYEDLIGKILGYSLARFKELENPAKNLFEFLSNLETALREELEPTLFSGGRAISTADIYDFLGLNIKSGIPSKETSELLELLPKLKERQEGFKNSQTLPPNPKIVEDTQQTLPSDYSPQSKSLELIAGFKNQLVQGLGAFFENTNISKASYEKYRLLGVDKFFSDFDIASIHNLGLNKDYSQIYTGALQNGKHFELEIQQISPSNNTGLNFHQKIIFKIAKSSGEVEKKLEWIKHYYKTSQKDSTLFENGISIELNNGEKNKLLNYKQNAKSAKLEIQTQPLQETLEQKHNLLPDEDFKSFLELKVIGDDPRAREYKGENIYNPQRGIYSTLGVNFNNTKEAKAFIDEAQSELTNKEIELLKDNFKEVEIKTDYADYDGRIGKGYPPYIKLNDEKAKALLEYKIKSLGFDESNHFLDLFEKYAKNQNEFLKANGEPFGINFKLPESKDKGKLALKVLSDAKMGQVKGAFFREDLKELSGNGEIDLVWGEVTNPQTHKGYGLAHIIDKHPNFDINLIPQIVERGELVDLQNGKVRIITDKYTIGMKKEWKDKSTNAYILTAFENNKESAKNLHSSTLTKGETLPLNSDTIIPQKHIDTFKQAEQEKYTNFNTHYLEDNLGLDEMGQIMLDIQDSTKTHLQNQTNFTPKTQAQRKQLMEEALLIKGYLRGLRWSFQDRIKWVWDKVKNPMPQELYNYSKLFSFKAKSRQAFLEHWHKQARAIEEEYNKLFQIIEGEVKNFDYNLKIQTIQERFKYNATKAKDLLEWHKDSSYITKDEEGLPKVFYHGAKRGSANREILEPRYINDTGSAYPAMFFSTNKSNAESYIDGAYLPSSEDSFYKVFINAKKPLVIDFKGKSFIDRNELVDEIFKGGRFFDTSIRKALESAKEQGNPYDSIVYKNVKDNKYGGGELGDTIAVFNPNQIKAVDNKGSVIDTKTGELKTARLKDRAREDFKYFNDKSPNIYHSNPHLGSGLVGGSVAGFEVDKEENINFNPTNFLLGLIGGSVGSKGIAKGFKILKDNPHLKQKLQEELANALSQGWESATQKYPILSTLEPRYIVKNEKGREIQVKGVLKEVEKGQIYSLRESAKQTLSSIVGENIVNIHDGRIAQVTKRNIGKMTSDKAIAKSVANGFSAMEHFNAVNDIESLYKNAIFKETQKDNKSTNPNTLIHRYESVYDNQASALITLKESLDPNTKGNKIYTLELEELKSLELKASAPDPQGESLSSRNLGYAEPKTPDKNPKSILPQKN